MSEVMNVGVMNVGQSAIASSVVQIIKDDEEVTRVSFKKNFFIYHLLSIKGVELYPLNGQYLLSICQLFYRYPTYLLI